MQLIYLRHICLSLEVETRINNVRRYIENCDTGGFDEFDELFSSGMCDYVIIPTYVSLLYKSMVISPLDDYGVSIHMASHVHGRYGMCTASSFLISGKLQLMSFP